MIAKDASAPNFTQPAQDLRRLGAERRDIAQAHDAICAAMMNVGEHSLEREGVAVNIGDESDAHSNYDSSKSRS